MPLYFEIRSYNLRHRPHTRLLRHLKYMSGGVSGFGVNLMAAMCVTEREGQTNRGRSKERNKDDPG